MSPAKRRLGEMSPAKCQPVKSRSPAPGTARCEKKRVLRKTPFKNETSAPHQVSLPKGDR